MTDGWRPKKRMEGLVAPAAAGTPSGEEEDGEESPGVGVERNDALSSLLAGKRRREEECVRHCVVCHERAREVAFDPCGHFVCCSECGLRVSTCPLCRGAIERNLRIYVG